MPDCEGDAASTSPSPLKSAAQSPVVDCQTGSSLARSTGGWNEPSACCENTRSAGDWPVCVAITSLRPSLVTSATAIPGWLAPTVVHASGVPNVGAVAAAAGCA